jgi:hypothetical protein
LRDGYWDWDWDWDCWDLDWGVGVQSCSGEATSWECVCNGTSKWGVSTLGGTEEGVPSMDDTVQYCLQALAVCTVENLVEGEEG